MAGAAVGFPVDWLEHDLSQPATDLDLAVLLINSWDLLDDPPDRLRDLAWLGAALRAVGHDRLADELSESDVPALRRLRDRLRPAFEATGDATAAAVLNPLVIRARAVPVLVADSAGVKVLVAPERSGVDALAARLPAALVTFIGERGVRRLGTCAAGPCTCAFIDRTRARTRRFCCTYCNDREAARSYRARRSHQAD